MSDDLIKRLQDYASGEYDMTPICSTLLEAKDRVEQLEREKAELSASLDENWVTHQEVLFSKRYAAKAEAKLAKAVEALREINQDIMFHTDETSWRVWGEEAVINIRKVLAELEGGE